MRNRAVSKKAFNTFLGHIESLKIGEELGAEQQIADFLEASRTTARQVLKEAKSRGIVSVEGREKKVLRHPVHDDYYPIEETESVSSAVERAFMNYALHGELRPGDVINGLALARQLEVSPNALREYLNRFERFGLVERRPNTSWVFQGFTESFARELLDVRDMFELHAAEKFFELMDDAALRALRMLEEEHVRLARDIDSRFHDFSKLDENFHRLLGGVGRNRFIDQLREVISLVFHYHFQWDKSDEQERNAVAIDEHLEIIRAFLAKDKEKAIAATKVHLNTAGTNLLKSIASTGHLENA
ncbi:GntR family transcriptional regulator [Polycladidibacter hongkongensis]|uniref:GntR family transcriptional regulator n=1 Tax=Polycladidibacter hongkongensis TaxID=1647556 RepID=UPI000833426E|nr:GntR family transcriptional regulator [Pseudovibrio hongkongensis]